MPTDPNTLDPRRFDAETARDASLAATLSWVRLCRRVRRSAGASAALLAVAATVWLAMPPRDPTQDQHVTENSLVIRSTPLTAAQRIVSRAEPELFVRTLTDQAGAMRIVTSRDAAVPRLAEAEFHNWLAAHGHYCIQLAGGPAQVLPLRPE